MQKTKKSVIICRRLDERRANMMILDRKGSKKTKICIYTKKANSNKVMSRKTLIKRFCDSDYTPLYENRYVR